MCMGGRLVRGIASLVAGTADLVFPTRCVGCNEPGTLLCDECTRMLPLIDQDEACRCCGAPYGLLTCTECKHDWELERQVSAAAFEGAVAAMTVALKDQHERRLAPVMASLMARAAGAVPGYLDEADAICFVPATREAYVRRGFDHMELVSRELSDMTGLPLLDCLARVSARDQRNLGRSERESNLDGTVLVTDDVRGLRLLLADDVVTSGATMRACARALLRRSAKDVRGLSLARVWGS